MEVKNTASCQGYYYTPLAQLCTRWHLECTSGATVHDATTAAIYQSCGCRLSKAVAVTGWYGGRSRSQLDPRDPSRMKGRMSVLGPGHGLDTPLGTLDRQRATGSPRWPAPATLPPDPRATGSVHPISHSPWNDQGVKSRFTTPTHTFDDEIDGGGHRLRDVRGGSTVQSHTPSLAGAAHCHVRCSGHGTPAAPTLTRPNPLPKSRTKILPPALCVSLDTL